MRKAIHRLIAPLFCVATAVCGAQNQQQNPPPPAVTAPQASTGANAKDLKTDLQRMRLLLGQMQKNAAFVSAGDTPLKHQFELEIQMWQLLIEDMENKALLHQWE